MERHNPAARYETRIVKPSTPVVPFRERISPFPSSEPLLPSTELPPHRTSSAIPYTKVVTVTDAPSEQIDPALTANASNAKDRAAVTAGILTKLRAPYDRYDRYLKRLQKRLKASVPGEQETCTEQSEECDVPHVYPTLMGDLSFQELHERTRKYVAYALRLTYQVNEADIDDGLQAGYFRLWQRLEKEPELLADKALAWIGKGIIYSALHATRGDWQYRRKTQVDGKLGMQAKPPPQKGNFMPHSWESRQAEIRIDLHRVIGEVAESILAQKRGKRRDHDLWALYGLTMQQVSASELSRLFGVREQSMQAAYNRVRERLQKGLTNYTPSGITTPSVRRGREALPQQDVNAIKEANGDVPDEIYEAVKMSIETTDADTRIQDELALEGIRCHIPAQTQARIHGVSRWKMQRAYTRVHLMIGAERDPSVRTRRPERRVQSVFTLTSDSAIAVERLALELLQQPKSYEKLVALHAHMSNLAISTTAKHFNIPTSTLRYYTQQFGRILNTPTERTSEREKSNR